MSAPSNPSVNWRWFLAEPVVDDMGSFVGFNRLGTLKAAHNRQLNVALNGIESASFTINTLDTVAELMQSVTTCIVCYRNGKLKWSGPLWTIDETLAEGQQSVNVTCVGWPQLLMYRLLKCGNSADNPMVGPTSTSTAINQYYFLQDPGQIAADLISRTNYEFPTGISIGTVIPNPNGVKWTVTYNQLQNIGQAIQQLSNIEGGFDFWIDPETLAFNVYYNPLKAGYTVYGRGQDRPNAVFRHRVNISSLRRFIDASKLNTQHTAIGQYGQSQYPSPAQSTGRGDIITPAIMTYGLWEGMTSLASIVSQTITEAFATAEVLFLQYPQSIYSFTPISYHRATENKVSVSQPFEDYDIGDYVYLGANYGRMRIPPIQGDTDAGPAAGLTGYLPVRVFAMQIAIDDNGNEKVNQIQTAFATTS